MTLPKPRDMKLWLAVLKEIEAAGGAAKPADLYPKLVAYFPLITPEDLTATNPAGGNKWTNQVQWARLHMVVRGLLQKSAPGTWAISEAGRRWLQENWKGPEADYSQLKAPPATGAAPKEPKGAEGAAKPTVGKLRDKTAASVSAKLAVVDIPESLCNRLTEAQRLADTYGHFEVALRDAFEFLGFEAIHIGTPGETDILLKTHLGKDSYSVVVDAKSSKSGKVTDSQINWPAIDSHKKQKQADYAVVVGEEFAGGNLKKWAEQYQVVLIKTDTICQAIRLHAETPFGLIDLRHLFSEYGLGATGLDTLTRLSRESRRRWDLALAVVELMDAYNAKVPQGLAPKADALHAILLGKVISGEWAVEQSPSIQDIRDTLSLLGNPAVGVVRELPGSDETYQLVMTAATAKRRLSCLASVFAIGQLQSAGVAHAEKQHG